MSDHMMDGERQRILVVNILLPRRLTRLLSSAAGRQESRSTEEGDNSFLAKDPNLSERQLKELSDGVVDRLYRSDNIVQAMALAEWGEDDTDGMNPDELQMAMEAVRHREQKQLTTWELGNGPAPTAIPIVNVDMGVVSTPAFTIEDVRQALQGLEVEDVQTAKVYRTMYQRRVADASPAVSQLGRVGAAGLGGWEVEHLWFEAALSVNEASQVTPWGIDRINAPTVWRRGNRGRGVRVAIVDTGTGPHVDLPQPAGGATFVPGTNSYHDGRGHGTHVAGTVVAIDNDRGVVGVAPQADLLVARVLDSNGEGYDTWIANGMTWAVNQGAKVLNLSLGGGRSETIIRAVDYAETRGAVVCAAAGNGYCRSVIYPAAYERCVAVAASSRSDTRCSFSNCGPQLDVSAPGCGILSTVLGGGYEEWGGTSMATPHVSGVVALMFAANPNFKPEEVRARLRSTARPLGSSNHFGAGLVQADKAVPETTIPPDPCEPDPCPPSDEDAVEEGNLAERIAMEALALAREHVRRTRRQRRRRGS